MEEDSQQEFRQIGILQLIRNMLSPRTLPHIIMIAVISSILLFLVSTQEVLVAMSFINHNYLQILEMYFYCLRIKIV